MSFLFDLNLFSFNVSQLSSIFIQFFMSIFNTNIYFLSLSTSDLLQIPTSSQISTMGTTNLNMTILGDGFFFFHSALFLSCFVMMLGFFGIIFGGLNLIFILIGVELMVLSIISLFITISAFTINPYGELNSLFLIGTAASESVLVLAVLIRMAYFDKTVVLRDSKYSVRG